MRLFEDEPTRPARSGADWEQHRRHRHPQSGPPQDEVGVVAMSSFVLARTGEVVVAVRGITAFSDGLLVHVVVLFADEQRTEDLGWSLQEFSRSPGRFRVGVVFSDGRLARTGTRDAPDVEPLTGLEPQIVLMHTVASQLFWEGQYWLTPVPPAGSLVIGCRWPDRAIPETLVQLDPTPLVAAAAASRPVWLPAEEEAAPAGPRVKPVAGHARRTDGHHHAQPEPSRGSG